jgi:hypothetical protein
MTAMGWAQAIRGHRPLVEARRNCNTLLRDTGIDPAALD